MKGRPFFCWRHPMRLARFGLALAALLSLLALPANAQVVSGSVRTADPSYLNGESRPLSLTPSGALRVVESTVALTGASAPQVQGTFANGAAPVGNPFSTACFYSVGTSPLVPDNAMGRCQATQRGSMKVTLFDTGATAIGVSNAGSDTINGAASNGLNVTAFGTVFDGTNFTRARSVVGAASTGLGTQAVAVAPHTVAAGAVVPARTTAAASSLVVKASAGNLYGWQVVAGASAGFVLVLDATSLPANGAVTPVQCVPVAANEYRIYDPGSIPDRYNTGIVIAFSTTGCFNLTASNAAFIRSRGL